MIDGARKWWPILGCSEGGVSQSNLRGESVGVYADPSIGYRASSLSSVQKLPVEVTAAPRKWSSYHPSSYTRNLVNGRKHMHISVLIWFPEWAEQYSWFHEWCPVQRIEWLASKIQKQNTTTLTHLSTKSTPSKNQRQTSKHEGTEEVRKQSAKELWHSVWRGAGPSWHGHFTGLYSKEVQKLSQEEKKPEKRYRQSECIFDLSQELWKHMFEVLVAGFPRLGFQLATLINMFEVNTTSLLFSTHFLEWQLEVKECLGWSLLHSRISLLWN